MSQYRCTFKYFPPVDAVAHFVGTGSVTQERFKCTAEDVATGKVFVGWGPTEEKARDAAVEAAGSDKSAAASGGEHSAGL